VKKTVSICALFALFVLFPDPARSAVQKEKVKCDDGMVEVSRQFVKGAEEDTITLDCQYINQLTSAEIARLTPEAKSVLSERDLQALEHTTSMASIADSLETMRGDVPRSLLLGWIEVESHSNWRLADVSVNAERGYFQIDPFEWCPLHGISQATCSTRWDKASKSFGDPEFEAGFEKLSADREYSLLWGVKLAQMHAREVRRRLSLGCAETSDSCSFWHFVKLAHSMNGQAVEKLVRQMRNEHVNVESWDAVSSYVQQQDEARLSDITGFGSDKHRLVSEVSRVFSSGAELNARFGQKR
jgi:hypothetical protein